MATIQNGIWFAVIKPELEMLILLLIKENEKSEAQYKVMGNDSLGPTNTNYANLWLLLCTWYKPSMDTKQVSMIFVR